MSGAVTATAVTSKTRWRIKRDDAMKFGAMDARNFDERRRRAEQEDTPIYTTVSGIEVHYVPNGNAGNYEMRHTNLEVLRLACVEHDILPLNTAGRPAPELLGTAPVAS